MILQASSWQSQKNLRGRCRWQNIKIKCKTWNISTSVVTFGSFWVAIEAKYYEEFKFLGFMRYFSARFQQSSKKHLKMEFLGSISEIYKYCGNLAENRVWNLEIWISHKILLLQPPNSLFIWKWKICTSQPPGTLNVF